MAAKLTDPCPVKGGGLTFVYYVTGHGYGHATRVVEVTRHLIAAGHTVHVVTGAPQKIWTTEIESDRLRFRTKLVDSGAIQSDALTVDRKQSLESYEKLFERKEEIISEETAFLREVGADLVVVDIAPMACTAARRAGLRCVVCTNFTWDYIYAECEPGRPASRARACARPAPTRLRPPRRARRRRRDAGQPLPRAVRGDRQRLRARRSAAAAARFHADAGVPSGRGRAAGRAHVAHAARRDPPALRDRRRRQGGHLQLRRPAVRVDAARELPAARLGLPRLHGARRARAAAKLHQAVRRSRHDSAPRPPLRRSPRVLRTRP